MLARIPDPPVARNLPVQYGNCAPPVVGVVTVSVSGDSTDNPYRVHLPAGARYVQLVGTL